eukprot:gene12283-14004_t
MIPRSNFDARPPPPASPPRKLTTDHLSSVRPYASREMVESVSSSKTATSNREGNTASALPSSSASTQERSVVAGVGLQELYKSPNSAVERALRMVIIGHNPSHQSWTKGHYYANPANRMWPILSKTGIVPKSFTCYDDQHCPSQVGIGFTDCLLGHCETHSARIDDNNLVASKASLYARLIDHCHRVSQDWGIPIEMAYPRVVAFAGVRQYRALFANEKKTDHSRKRKGSDALVKLDMFYDAAPSKLRKVDDDGDGKEAVETIVLSDDGESREEAVGQRDRSPIPVELHDEFQRGLWHLPGEEGKTYFGVQLSKPPDWPLLLQNSVVVLLPSTSGAAAMTTEAREAPYFLLSKLLRVLRYDGADNTKRSPPMWFYEKTDSGSSELTSSSVPEPAATAAKTGRTYDEIIILDDD